MCELSIHILCPYFFFLSVLPHPPSWCLVHFDSPHSVLLDLSSRNDCPLLISNPVIFAVLILFPLASLKIIYKVMAFRTTGGKCECLVYSLETEAFNFMLLKKK